MIPQDFIQGLLGRVDIVDVVDRYVKLKKAGANYGACCPFHNEKTPSFTVSPSKQFYHCFGCGAHGNAIGFLMEYSGLTYPDAIRSLAETVGLQVPETRSPRTERAAAEAPGLAARMLEALNYYRAELKKSKPAIDYLKGRGLDDAAIARFRLGFAPDSRGALKAALTRDGVPEGLLLAAVVDHLAKIALLVEQPHANHRNAQIAGGFELIASHIAQSSRIDREGFAQHEFHAEVRHAGQGRLGMMLLKPRGCRVRLLLGLCKGIDLLAEGRIGEHAPDLLPGDRLQDITRVMRQVP